MTAYSQRLFILPNGIQNTDDKIFEQLGKCALTKVNKTRWLSSGDKKIVPTECTLDTPVDIPTVKLEIRSDEFVSPSQKDTLFWCSFIAENGYGEYINVGNNYGIRALETRQRIGEFVRKNMSGLKTTSLKITKSACEEICSEMMTSVSTTSMECLCAIALYNKMNFLIMNPVQNIILQILSDRTEENTLYQRPTYLIQKDAFGKYHIRVEPLDADAIREWTEKTVCLENYVKPIKTMGAYKLDELEAMACKLGVISGPGLHDYKKAVLYQKVAERVAWT